MKATKLNITVPPHVAEWLRSTGNYSAYVTGLVEARWRRWNTALEALAAAGWTRDEFLALSELLRSTHVTEASILAQAAAGLRDAVASQHLERVPAHALVTCVEEHWTDNAAFLAALDRLPAAAKRRRTA